MHVLQWTSAISFLLAISYLFAEGYVLLFIITSLFNFFFPMLMPALDATASSLTKHEGLRYAKARSYGSIGFICSVLIVSMLSGEFGDDVFLFAMIAVLGVLTMMMWTTAPEIATEKPTAAAGEKASLHSVFRVPKFGTVLVLAILLQGAHAAYYNYGYLYLQQLDVPKFYIGFIINVSVILEIVLFTFADQLFKKWTPGNMFALAAAGSTIRWVLIYLFPNVEMFVVSQLFHSLSFALAHYAFMQFITKNVPTVSLANAQGLYATFAQSFATAILTFYATYLYGFSMRTAFLGMIICTIPALLIGLYIGRKQLSTAQKQ
ncbi:MFS transporter [Kurthia senegalensis]|uniref:MFS transporter n=1 Tax=Kurthia senegalensis TaxID=1033740 RepID=UPI0002F547B4|nr:MFS transporter [Kurthia senegalensis]